MGVVEQEGYTRTCHRHPASSPLDGAIQAVVVGYYFDDSKFNRAVDARRQPDSSFKPFVYAAALNKGYTPASLVRDEPVFVRYGRGRAWRSQNADHRNLGRIRMRVALTLNVSGLPSMSCPGVSRWPWVPPKYPRSRWPGPMPCSPTAASR